MPEKAHSRRTKTAPDPARAPGVVRRVLRIDGTNPDVFGSERSFSPELGGHWGADSASRGCYIDFRFKALSPQWPPPWLRPLRWRMHVATIQWGLGAYERFVCGEGNEWLQAAIAGGEHLIEHQHRGGPQDGGWRQFMPMRHTFRVDPPWLSAIAQGEAASLLVRLHMETADERFAESARRALAPLSVPVADGGVLSELNGAPFVEEYPTSPASHVLNGAIFALWGYRDVGVGLGDAEALERFEVLTAALAENLHRWDTGRWSRYDLFPHPVPNTASPAYHLLHIRQLEVLEKLSDHPAIGVTRSRFEDYRRSKACRRKAIAQKVAFRLLVPRNATLAHRLPWSRGAGAKRRGETGPDDLVVLCYHAVSEDWRAPLAVTPGDLDAQLSHLRKRGYRGVTFAEAIAGPGGGMRVAVTFDDGYRSVVRLAQPILEAHGLPATLFLPTDFVGTERPMGWPGIDRWLDGPHADELTPVSWEEARALVESGWEVGSHTCSHPRLTSLDDDRLKAELEGSRAECEQQLGRPCESLAYPYGDVDPRVMEAAMAAGYSAAAAVTAEVGAPAPYRWPRVGVYQVDGGRSFKLKVSRPLRRLQRSHAWGLLDAAVRPVRPRAR
ncbi:MAG: polysaccharide deacetylase family protein [Solirubrobacterales bacterium]|nr:polysaccharide deacetylase family protein [Solirubrobacterales bacterium]